MALDRPAGEPQLATPEAVIPSEEPAGDIPIALPPAGSDGLDGAVERPDGPEMPEGPDVPDEIETAPPAAAPGAEPIEPEFNLDDLFES
jgi:hypothetical protein